MMPRTDLSPSFDSAPFPVTIPHSGGAVPATLTGSSMLGTKPDAIALLKALRRRWLLALGVGLVCGAITAGIVYMVMPSAQYTARSMLYVNSVPPKILLTVKEAYTDYGAYQRTQLALLKSRLVLNAALKQEEVARLKLFDDHVDPIEWLEKELKVEFANGSEILRISMSGAKAEAPMLIVNAVTRAYLDEVVDVETRQRRERFDLLKETWNRYQESLREKRKELKRLIELAGSDDKKTLASLQQHELDRLGRAEDELARVQSELRNLQVEFEVLQEEQNLATSPVAPAMIEDEISRDHSIEILSERVAKAQSALDQIYRLTRQGSDPVRMRYRRELDLAKSALAAQRRKLYPIIARQLEEASHTDLGTREALLAKQLKILTEIRNSLADDVKRLSARSTTLNRNSVDLSSIQEEIASADEVARLIGVEVESLKLELQAPPRIRLLEKAELPRTKDENRAFKVAGMAGGGTLALVLVGISLWEFRERRINSADEVVHGLGMKLVGTLPSLPSQSRRRNSNDERSLRWQNILTESIDAARTAVLHVSQTEAIRVIMVASALGGEGKTSLASHLVISLARSGRRTLLIDGDLRRPSAHHLFDLPPGPGLSEVLRDEAEITDTVRPTLAKNLWLIPAGACDDEAVRALASKDLRAGFDQLREQFDFIVIDSSPVLPVADALLIGQHVDAVIFSVMRDVSRLPKIHAAYERLSSLGIRMLGAIVTGEPGSHYGSEYYDYPARDRDQS